MIRTEEVARLALDGAEITFDNSRQCWQVGGQDVRSQTLEPWQRQGFLKEDNFQRSPTTSNKLGCISGITC